MTLHSITPAAKAGQPVTVAVVAAGPQRLASLLEPHLPAPAGRLVIFDAAGSTGATPSMPGAEVELVAAAIGDAEGETELIRHSLPGFFSLRPPAEALRELFPGLRETGRHSVPVAPVTAMAARLGAASFTLILDLPGEELALLSRLERQGLLERVQRLTLRCGAERFFEGAMTADELQAWLGERGFNLTQRDERDSAWPVLDFTADHLHRRVTALERDLSERDAALDKAKAEAAGTAKRLQAAEAELQTARTVAETMQNAVAERDVALGEAEVEAAGMAKRLQVAEAELQTAKTSAETAQKTLAERDAALGKAEAEAAGTAKRLQALTDETRRLRLALRDSEELAQRARAGFDGMRADHGMLLSMLQARTDELAALRDSHRRLSDDKRALEELLGKLTPRLQEAAAQLGSLALLPGEPQAETHASAEQGRREWPRKLRGRDQ